MPRIRAFGQVAVLVSLFLSSCAGAESPQLHGLASHIIEEEPVAQLQVLQQVSDSAEYLLRYYKSPAHKEAAQQIERWMKLAGMTTWHDAIGNVHGELRGANASDSAILLGSHYDTVKDAGAYDGSMGVITAIAAVKALVATSSACETEAKSETVTRPDTDKDGILRDVTPCVDSFLEGLGSKTHVRVVGFTDEEGVRFQSTFLGSRALAGSLSREMLEAQDAEGTTLADTLDIPDLPKCPSTTTTTTGTPNKEEIEDAHSSCQEADSTDTATGSKVNKSTRNLQVRDPEVIQEVVRGMQLPHGAVHAYVEAHLEQGPVLEASGRPVGIVAAIAGQSRWIVSLQGEQGHAGTVPMQLRKDPLPVAGALIHAMQQRCTLPAPRPDSDIMHAMHTLLRRLPYVVPLWLQRGAAMFFSKLPDPSARWLQGIWTKVLASMQLPELPYLVCTVGTVNLWPGASNVIPKTVNFTVDIRSDDDTVRTGVEQWLQVAVSEACDQAKLPACTTILRNRASTVQSSESLTATLVQSAEAAVRWHSASSTSVAAGASSAVSTAEECTSDVNVNTQNSASVEEFRVKEEFIVEDESGGGAGFVRQVLETEQDEIERVSTGGCAASPPMGGQEQASKGGSSVPRMTSGAGHDALAIADVAPVAMLFVRCRGGISHSPEEYVAPDDVIVGTRVLLQLLLRDAGIVPEVDRIQWNSCDDICTSKIQPTYIHGAP